MSVVESGTHRRGFLGGMMAGLAAIALRPGDVAAEALAPAAPFDEAWIKRIKGKHRQVVDCTSHNNGFGIAYGLNFIDSTKDALGLADKDFTSVVVFRHFAFPLSLNDSVWEKYKIGELIDVKDPKTSAPATRNIFRDSIFGRPGLTYEQVMTTRPVLIAACNLALGAVAGMAAPKAGVSAETATAEFKAGLLPGVILAPSGVYAVNRAQQNGATYCNGG